MTALIKAYSITLTDKILKASSQDEVKCLCDASILWLKQQGMMNADIVLFAEEAIGALRYKKLANSVIVQWSCVTAARVYLNRIIDQYRLNRK